MTLQWRFINCLAFTSAATRKGPYPACEARPALRAASAPDNDPFQATPGALASSLYPAHNGA